MAKFLLSIPLLFFLLVGCDQKDITPSWVTIDDFTLTTNEPTQGSNSHRITDVWVYMDGNALGVFELPCKFPVLDEGQHSFILFPGVRQNGISDTRVRYPFYQPYELIASLVVDDTLAMVPETKYKDITQFPFIEDFEDAGISIVKGPISDTDIVFVSKDEFPDIVKYGDKCGGIYLNQTDTIYSGSTVSALELPKGGNDVYLEFDVRSNNSMVTGVIARYPDGTTNDQSPLVSANPQTKGEEIWKRLYVNLTENVSTEISATSYEFYLISILDGNHTEGEVYIDNIKVVHF